LYIKLKPHIWLNVIKGRYKIKLNEKREIIEILKKLRSSINFKDNEEELTRDLQQNRKIKRIYTKQK